MMEPVSHRRAARMAKTNLLDTKTATFGDLLGNGVTYRVPAFQRDYSWGKEHWDDLWQDLRSLVEQPDDRHYMGAVVLEATSDRERRVIDGQQRLATLSILVLAALQLLGDLGSTDSERAQNRERAELLRRNLIGGKSPTSLRESSKLLLNDENRGFYEDYLVQLRAPTNPRGLSKSNRLLWQCFQFFQAALRDLRLDGAGIARVIDEAVARQLLFIVISVDDELSAYTVFETLNARGLELTTTDLIKNWLFSRVRAHDDLPALERRWSHLLDTVEAERFADFLRAHFACEVSRIRKDQLFRLVRDRVKDGPAVFALLDELDRRADLFAAIGDAEHELWLDIPGAKPHIRELRLFRATQMTPLLFAAFERLSADDFVRVLKLVAVVSFRYSVISGLNPNDLEPRYHDAARGLLDGTSQGPADVFQSLRPIYVPDEKFQSEMATIAIPSAGTRKRLVKYILCRLETALSGKDCNPDSDPGTIEHVLPENADSQWDASFPRARQGDWVYRLGNMTLLEAGKNREIGRATFTDKKRTYETSRYDSTRALSTDTGDEWTPAVLEDWQRRMARRAVHVWRSDFT